MRARSFRATPTSALETMHFLQSTGLRAPVNASALGHIQASHHSVPDWRPTVAACHWIPTGCRTRRRSHHGILSPLTGLSRHTRCRRIGADSHCLTPRAPFSDQMLSTRCHDDRHLIEGEHLPVEEDRRGCPAGLRATIQTRSRIDLLPQMEVFSARLRGYKTVGPPGPSDCAAPS